MALTTKITVQCDAVQFGWYRCSVAAWRVVLLGGTAVPPSSGKQTTQETKGHAAINAYSDQMYHKSALPRGRETQAAFSESSE
jgi:hypothetical protein